MSTTDPAEDRTSGTSPTRPVYADTPQYAEASQSGAASGSAVASQNGETVQYAETSQRDGAGQHEAPTPTGERPTTVRQDVVAKQKEQFGGLKVGSALFGWLAATGTVVLLSAIAATVTVWLGYDADTATNQFADPTAWDVGTAAWIGGIIALVILFVAYFCGGYVAGRMARFNGVMQGLAVWLWAVIAVIVVTVVGLVAGNELDSVGTLDGLPQIGAQAEDFTVGGGIAALLAAAVTLGGAILGGVAGMRFHRRVDKAGLGK